MLLFISEASVLNTSPLLVFLMHPPYWDIAYEALGCLTHALEWTNFVFNQHLAFHLLVLLEELSIHHMSLGEDNNL